MGYTLIKKNCVGCNIEFMARGPKVRFCTVQCSKYGKHSHRWKGDNVGIDALHTYIKKYLPKPDKCVSCKKVPPMDLANISNEYKRDISDWEWLCRKCHMEKDGRIKSLVSNAYRGGAGQKRKEIVCLFCKKQFKLKRRSGKYCSSICSGKHRTQTTIEKLKKKLQ